MQSLDEDGRRIRRYLVILKFEGQEEPIETRLKEHVPLIKQALSDISAQPSKIELAFVSKHGSVIGIAVRTSLASREVLSHIHSHKYDAAPSPTRLKDQIMVLEIGADTTVERIETLDGWLNKTRTV